ncbi:MAG: GNAT family N-acetyltransferase [Candidatus Stahlbacteria bacterium]|nr:GNAT family N-acetyltransferase [Candidatus Stahlbacteria bacterium]
MVKEKSPIKIINLTPENEKLFFVCLEDWSDEIKEAGNHKEIWCNKMKDKGLRVKLALDDNGVVGGMIQYIPVEYSSVDGKDLYFINCIWVHGYKQGRGNFHKKGMGKALLQAAEEDVKNLGAKGIVAWGIPLPFWMSASWFKKHGYKKIDKLGGLLDPILLWKPFAEDAVPPKWIRQKKTPIKESGKVVVTVLKNGWCPAQNMVFERAKRASLEFLDKVIFREVDHYL